MSLLTRSTELIAMADTTRALMLLVFIAVLFGVAALAVFVGQRRSQAQQNRELTKDAGIEYNAAVAGDTTASEEWLDATTAEFLAEADTPRQSWQDHILGDGLTAPVAEPEPEVEPETEPEVEPVAEPEVEPETEPEVEPVAEPEVEPETEPEVEPAPEVEVEAEVEAEVEPEVEAEAEPEAEPEAEVSSVRSDPLFGPLTDPLVDADADDLYELPQMPALALPGLADGEAMDVTMTDAAPLLGAGGGPLILAQDAPLLVSDASVSALLAEDSPTDHADHPVPSGEPVATADVEDASSTEDFDDLDVPALPPMM